MLEFATCQEELDQVLVANDGAKIDDVNCGVNEEAGWVTYWLLNWIFNWGVNDDKESL